MRLHWKIPLLLFLATCLTTTFCRLGFDNEVLHRFLLTLCLIVAGAESAPQYWIDFTGRLWVSLQFSMALMLILIFHELGHYIQF